MSVFICEKNTSTCKTAHFPTEALEVWSRFTVIDYCTGIVALRAFLDKDFKIEEHCL